MLRTVGLGLGAPAPRAGLLRYPVARQPLPATLNRCIYQRIIRAHARRSRSTESMPADANDLERELYGLTVAQLKENLSSRNLPIYGNKSDLVARLAGAMEAAGDASAAASPSASRASSAEPSSPMVTALLERFSREQLIALCSEQGVAMYGTKQQLAERLVATMDEDEVADAIALTEESPENLAAAAAGTESQLSRKDIYSMLMDMSDEEINTAMSDRSLPLEGDKEGRVGRLTEQLMQELVQQQQEARAQNEDEAAVQQGGVWGTLEEQLAADLRRYSYQELSTALAQRGIVRKRGRKEDLVNLLTELVVQDYLQTDYAGAAPVDGSDEALLALADGELALPAGQIEPEQRAYLLAEKAAALAEQYGELSKEELLQELDARGLETDERKGARELRELLAFAEAEVVVDALVAQAARASAAADEAADLKEMADYESAEAILGAESEEEQSEAQRYANMTLTEIRKLKVTELRHALRVFGLSDIGNRYELCGRLESAMQARKAAATGSIVVLTDQVRSMTMRELRRELNNRGLATGGAKVDLEARLVDVLARESGSHMLDSESESDDDGEAIVLEPMELIYEGYQDPEATVALVFGGSSDWQLLAESLHALVDVLHTAPLGAAAEQTDTEASGDGAEQQQQQQQQRQGLTAELYYVDDSMVTWQVPLATVLSSTPSELASRAVAEGTALGSLADLGQRAAAAGSVVLPVLHGGALFAANVVSELSKAGAALAASPAEALRLAGDKWRLMVRLQQLGFPTLPTFRMVSEDAASEESLQAWQASFLEFCSKLGWDPEVQVFVVKPAKGTLGSAVTPAKGTDRASLAARIMLQRNMDDTVVIEPYMRDDMQFSCTVLDTPDGPVALMPTEIELYDIEVQLYRHKLELFQWEMEQQGFPQEIIEAKLQVAAAIEPNPEYGVASSRPRQLPLRSVKYHSPPRLSRKAIHSIRHAAAKLFRELGLQGMATLQGWAQLQPGWQQRYAPQDSDELPVLPDEDLAVMARLKEQREAAEAAEPLPMAEYYDDEIFVADLDAFDQQARCRAEHNGEATIYFTDVNTAGPVGPTDMAFVAAAEVGVPAGALLRNVLNAAAERAGLALHIPAPAPHNVLDTTLASHVRVEIEMAMDEEAATLAAGYEVDPLVAEMQSRLIAGLIEEEIGEDEQQQEQQQQAEQQEEGEQQQGEALGAEFEALESQQLQPEQQGEQELLLPSEEPTYGESLAAAGAAGEDYRLTSRFDYSPHPVHARDLQAEEGVIFSSSSEPEPEQQGGSSGEVESHEIELSDDEYLEVVDHEEEAVQRVFKATQKVWVLVGGEGAEREASIASGINMASKLQRCEGFRVEPMLVAPQSSSTEEQKRRAALLQRRTEWLAMGMAEEDLPPHMGLHGLRAMPAPEVGLDRTWVWALPANALLRSGVMEVAECCERMSALYGVAMHAQQPLQVQQLQAQLEVQLELDSAGVEGVAGAWGGNPGEAPMLPRLMDLDHMLEEAAAQGAIVLSALRGATAATMATALESRNVPFGGSAAAQVALALDKSDLADTLNELMDAGSYPPEMVVFGMEQRVLDVQEALENVLQLDLAQQVFDDLAGELGTEALALKPRDGDAGVGVAKITCAKDLVLYCEALRQNRQYVPANSFTYKHPALTFPDALPDELVAEPWVATPQLLLKDGSWQVDQWPDESLPYVEASVGLLGNRGEVEPLAMSFVTRGAAGELERQYITPAPRHLIKKHALLAAFAGLRSMADLLGLEGLTQVDCFVNTDTGELIIFDINATPDLSPNSPLFGQAAAAAETPMLPHQLLHKVVSLALDRESPEAAVAAALGIDEADDQEDDDADFFDDLDEYEASEQDDDEELMVSEGGEEEVEGDGGDGGAEGGEQAGQQQLQASW